MSGDTLEETVLLTQTWPKVVMDTDLTTGQAGSLNLREKLISSKKYYSLFIEDPSLYSHTNINIKYMVSSEIHDLYTVVIYL